MIVHRLSTELDEINIYPLGDQHIGSETFSEEHWRKWKAVVENDPKGYIVIVGDLLDNGLKNSKSNTYEQTMRPREQKAWLTRELMSLKDKILGAVRGNHENRSVDGSDDCPLYDVMAKLDIEDLYRENMAFIKVNLGFRNKERQHSYMIVLGHGQGRGKTENFSYTVDGMDVLITGHTHQPTSRFPSKIVIDSKNEVVNLKGYTHITVPSFAVYGGYALKGMYLPQDSFKIPIITLSGNCKEVKVTWM